MSKIVRLVSALALAAGLTLALGGQAFAMEPSPEFGAHVAQMAAVDQHPLEHGGKMFGECVSTMATGQDCEHAH